MFSGYYLAVIEDPGAGSPEYKGKKFSKKYNKCSPKMIVAILFLLATNIPMALYMSLVHQVSYSLFTEY
jgi:phosphatidylinositol glycan class B